MIKAVACVSEDWGLGKKNGLLFNLPKDLAKFKEITFGHTVVFGYNTLLSLPHSKPLINRTNVVLCPEGIEPENCIVFHDLDELITFINANSETDDIFICGGASMYKQLLPYCDECIITKVAARDPETEVFFPNLDIDKQFKVTNETNTIEDGQYKIKFVTYRRVSR